MPALPLAPTSHAPLPRASASGSVLAPVVSSSNPPLPSTPAFDYQAAQAAISNLFSKEHTEDLPIDKLHAAAQLSEEHFKALLQRLDEENKVMVHAGTAYLI